MATEEDTLRQRKTGASNGSATSSTTAKDGKPAASRITLLDILRILGGLLIVSAGTSWMITGDSVMWGYKPWWTRWQSIYSLVSGPVRLTDKELLVYDGRDPNKPIYVALNGSIYDVTVGRAFYGPGGSYQFFAGRDAARAFVTGCFAEDLTADLRGVEEMFIPIDAEDAAEGMDGDELKRKGGKAGPKKAELKVRREREVREAKKKVADTLEGWAKMFRGEKGKAYFWVGEVVREPGWLDKIPPRPLCDRAKKSRPMRKPGEV